MVVSEWLEASQTRIHSWARNRPLIGEWWNGRHRGLGNLSTWVGNSHVNRVKFGGTPFGTIPSEALAEERVETRRRAPKHIMHGEGIVQTTTQ